MELSANSDTSAAAVDDLLRNHVQADTALSFFFCKENDAESVLAATALRSLIRQCLTAEVLTDAMHAQISSLVSDGTPEPNEFTELFTGVACCFCAHFVVIDGWDECAALQCRAIMDVLGRVAASAQPVCLKVFIARCDNISTKVPSSFLSSSSVTVCRRHVDTDIKEFVDETLQMKISQRELLVESCELLGEVQQALVTGADGMYVVPTLTLPAITVEDRYEERISNRS
jgi:hypothetical protein